MPNFKPPLFSPDELRALLDYDPATGIFRWRYRAGGRALKGSVAGTPSVVRGDLRRIVIVIRGRFFGAHILAWYWMTGEWPNTKLDHKDRDPGNNQWANIRRATDAQNAFNATRRRDNTTGYRGVYVRGRRFCAQINVAGRRTKLGAFSTASDAARAYDRAAEILHGEFANLNFPNHTPQEGTTQHAQNETRFTCT